MTLIQVTGRGGEVQEVESDETVLYHTYDEITGGYLGLLDAGVRAPGMCPAGSAPPPEGTWKMQNGEWVRVITLVEAKLRKWAQIKALRQEKEWGGFTWDGSVFDSDAASQSRIMSAATYLSLMALPSSFSKVWTLADNTTRTLDATQMRGVVLALGAHIETLRQTSTTLRAAIAACTNLEGVDTISWP